VSIGGIYIGPRTVVTFGAELLWLGLSTIALILVNYASLGEPLTVTALFLQTFVLVALYLATFYVMDLYDSALITPTRALLLNLVQATGILLVIVGMVTAGTHILSLDSRVVLAHTLLTIAFVLIARLAIEHSADRVTGRGISFLFLPPSDPRQGVEGGRFSSPEKIDFDDAFKIFVRLLMGAHGK